MATIELKNPSDLELNAIRDDFHGARIERLDKTFVNVTLADTEVDSLTDFLDDEGIEWSLI